MLQQLYQMSKVEIESIDDAFNMAIDQACVAMHTAQCHIVINSELTLTPAARIEAIMQIQKRIDKMKVYLR